MIKDITQSHGRYKALTRANIRFEPEWESLGAEAREAIDVVGAVLPFRTNPYVLRELVDLGALPDDPIFQLTFPQRDMLEPEDFAHMADLVRREEPRKVIEAAAREIRAKLNPHPAGQTTHNVPTLDGRELAGMQHKYRETLLFFPAAGQTCHAYCTFCFRWAQFVEGGAPKFHSRESEDLHDYLAAHPEVSDLLITGGDPLIMKTRVLRSYLGPILEPELEHVQSIRFGTKSVAYWPQRFVTDADADDLLRFFEEMVQRGRHVAVMGHYNHPRELATEMAREAVRRIRATGAEIRMQSPLIRYVNDDPRAWAELWREGVRLGCVPYYMFVERDTGPRAYFEVPLERTWRIFRQAYQSVSGLARTVRGPSMSALPGKVLVDGVAEIAGETVFVLQFLQARDPDWVRRPFFAKFDSNATWLDDLEPAFGRDHFFFETERPEVARVRKPVTLGREVG